MKLFFTQAGAWIGFGIVSYNALRIWQRKDLGQSIATWLMWTMLDLLSVLTTNYAGEPILLPFGWLVGAFLTTSALVFRGTWEWGWRETLAARAASVATLVWLSSVVLLPKMSPVGVIAATIALVVAGSPLALDMARNPVRSTFPIWFGTIVSGACTLIGSDWSLASTFLPFGSIALNIALCILVLRDKKSSTAFQEGRL